MEGGRAKKLRGIGDSQGGRELLSTPAPVPENWEKIGNSEGMPLRKKIAKVSDP